MKRRSVLVLATAVTLGALVPVWAQRTFDRPGPVAQARGLADDLKDAQRLLDRLFDNEGRGTAREREGSREREANRRQLRELLERSERTAQDLQDEVLRLRASVRDRRDDRVIERLPMRDGEADRIVYAIRQARSSGEEMRIIREAASQGWYTSRQLHNILVPVSRPVDQEEAAALFYPRLVDPVRFSTIRDALKSSGSWENILRRLGMR